MVGIEILLHIGFILILFIASLEDFRTHLVSDKIHVVIFFLGLLRCCFAVSIVGMVITAMPFFLAALLSDGKIGGGDVKFMAAVGFYLGASQGVLALMIGLFLAVIYGCVIKKVKNEPLPLIPFLSVGSAVALLI